VKRVRELEGVLLRGEGGAVVVLVLAMLVLAGYNVVYRNVLMPLQTYWAHSGPPLSEQQAAAKEDEPATKTGDAKDPGKSDDAGGFRGGFGAPEEGAAETEGEPDDKEGAEDFGGAFGKEAEEEEEEPEPAPEEGEEPDDAGGFGGGFGKKAPELDEEEGEEELEDDLDDQFANLPDIDKSLKSDETVDEGGPPPEGSFAAWGVEFVNTLRMDWIDALLRQLVILASFFGAALATARGKHINVDALSKILPPAVRRWSSVLTNLLALAVCIVLTSAGQKLVAISREFPSEVTPFLDEWHMQLMFPLGFGLLAFHFSLRVLEGVLGWPPPWEDQP
jgi:TRAP-type C4-dicarboxylate transport system permease small subunit